MTDKLTKTSVQLPSDMLRWMDAWPGISRSEAIRLSLERTQYLSTLKLDEISDLAARFRPILAPALEDFRCEDFRTIARALPAIVDGFIEENDNGPWKDGHNRELDTNDLRKKLQTMHPVERIHLLDCIVAMRHELRPIRDAKPAARRRRR